MKFFSKLSKHNVVRGLPNIKLYKYWYVKHVSKVNKPNPISNPKMQ